MGTEEKALYFTKELAEGMFKCRKGASTIDCVDCPVAEYCQEVVKTCQNAAGKPDANVSIVLNKKGGEK